MKSITANLTSQEIQLPNKKTYIYDIDIAGYSTYDDNTNYEDIYDVSCYIFSVWDLEDEDNQVLNPEIIESIEAELDLEDLLREHSN